MNQLPLPDDEDELPPYIGARIVASLHNHFDMFFGREACRPAPATEGRRQPKPLNTHTRKPE